MTNIKTELNEDKIKIIRTYKDGDLLSFIDEIRGKESRALLNKFLDFFVPEGSKNIKSNIEKYGLKTKQHFLTKFKNDSIATSKMHKNIDNKLQESATKAYANIYILWLTKQSGIDRHIDLFDNIKFDSNDFIDKVLEGCKQEKYPKEVVEKFYKYSPFINVDETLERKISRLKYQYVDYIDALKKERQFNYANSERLEELEKSNIESIKQNKKLENTNAKLINDIAQLTEENTNIREQYNELVIEINQQKEQINEINKENLSLKNEKIKLQNEINKIDTISNPLKMKESLQNKINELNDIITDKNIEIENLKYEVEMMSSDGNIKNSKEYIYLKQKYDKIANFRMQEFDKKIQEDKKLQQIILSLILNNSTASKLVIEHLNLREEVINEGYDYYDNEMIDKKIELGKLQKQAKDLENYIKELQNEKATFVPTAQGVQQKNAEKKNLINTNRYYTYDSTLNSTEISKIFNNSNNGFVQKFEASNFIIIDENKFKQYFNLQSIKIPFCDVIVEPNWHNYEDWFGKYENGVFHPAKTMVSDYYRFVKNTPDLPFGLIIFRNFNKILPEIYLQSFIESMELNGSFSLVHPSECNDDGEFATIENLPNLKYIMVKTDNENSFSIPKTLEKYII